MKHIKLPHMKHKQRLYLSYAHGPFLLAKMFRIVSFRIQAL